MALPISQLILGAGIVTTGAAATFGGAYLYENADTIFNWKSTSEIDLTNYQYVVAEVETVNAAHKNLLYKDKDKNYQCKFSFAEQDKIFDDSCEIFLTNVNLAKDTGINLSRNRFGTNALKTQTNIEKITANGHVLVKLKPELVETLKNSESKSFAVGEKGENGAEIYQLKYVYHAQEKDMVDRISNFSTSLFTFKLTEKSNHTTELTSASEYECKIGTTETKLACKLYTYKDPTESYAIKEHKTLTSTIVPTTSLTQSDHVVVQLTDTEKTYIDLQYQDIVVALKNSSTEIAKGRFASLLFGVISETVGSSTVFPVENLDHKPAKSVSSNNKKSLILTSGGTLLKTMSGITKSNYFCRVIINDQYFDDDDCQVSEIDKSSTDLKTINPADYQGDKNGITDTNNLTAGKHQIIELKSSLQKKLTSLPKDQRFVYLLKASEKTRAWNNRIITLNWRADITNPTIDEDNLPISNLFLVRTTSKQSSITTEDLKKPFKCFVDANTSRDCLLHKFGTDIKTNELTKNALSSAISQIGVAADLDANKFLVLELIDQPSSPSLFFDKKINIKNSDSKDLAVVEYDQILFGLIPSSIATSEQKLYPLARQEEFYLVEKDDAFKSSSTAIGVNYRCALELAGSDRVKNVDDGCQLVALTPTSGKKLLTYEELLAAKTKDTSAISSDTTKKFYKLIVDKNRLHMLNSLIRHENDRIVIYPITSGSTPSTNAAVKFKITNKLETTLDDTEKSKLILGQVKGTKILGASMQLGKCAFSETLQPNEGVDCSIHKTTGIANNENDFTKLTVTPAVITASENFNLDTYYIIDLKKNAQSIANLNNDYFYYHFTDNGIKKSVKFEISGILAGDFKAANNLVFLKTPTAHTVK